jgi:hypothetical protein
MLLKTHDIFAAGVLSLAGSLFIKNPAYNISIAFILSFIGNHAIDILGHEKQIIEHPVKTHGFFKSKKEIEILPVRTYHTHSFLRGTIYGFLPALILYIFFRHVKNMGNTALPYPDTLNFILIQGLLVGPAHLFLDTFTNGGIFVKRNGNWRKWSIANFEYNDFFANLTASLIGILCFVPFIPKNQFSNHLLILIKHII